MVSSRNEKKKGQILTRDLVSLGIQLDQSLLEQQSKAYKVEGVDEDAPAAAAAPKKRKKQHVNGEEVSETDNPPPPGPYI